MAAILLAWLVLEHLTTTRNRSTLFHSDNIPAYSWATRCLRNEKNTTLLVRALALRQRIYQAALKNGSCGAMIRRSAMDGIFCPVKALVRRFVYLRDNNVKTADIISSYWDDLGKGNLTDVDIRVALRRAVILLGLSKNGITAERVGMNSLRAGGATA